MRAGERKVRQAVLNLLSNAIKFTPKGTVAEPMKPDGLWSEPSGALERRAAAFVDKL
jgi:hypothetical protein